MINTAKLTSVESLPSASQVSLLTHAHLMEILFSVVVS